MCAFLWMWFCPVTFFFVMNGYVQIVKEKKKKRVPRAASSPLPPSSQKAALTYECKKIGKVAAWKNNSTWIAFVDLINTVQKFLANNKTFFLFVFVITFFFSLRLALNIIGK